METIDLKNKYKLRNNKKDALVTLAAPITYYTSR